MTSSGSSSSASKARPIACLCDDLRRSPVQEQGLRGHAPADVNDARWQAALRGLQAFVAGGWGDLAEAAGWTRDELYAVPKLWSQIHLTGVALLIADNEVTEVALGEIRIRTASGAVQTFRRTPEPDWALVYLERLKLSGLDAVREEPRLRAIEFTVSEYRKYHGVDLETAKAAVRTAIALKGKTS
jgi:hypothetical protein